MTQYDMTSIFIAFMGLVFVIFHRKLSEFAANNWNMAFPKLPAWKRAYRVLFLFVGIIFITVGILTFSQVIHFKK
jgi:hypothetical protein